MTADGRGGRITSWEHGGTAPGRAGTTIAQENELILEWLAEGIAPAACAEGLVDRDVAAGEYEGCSSELEMAYAEYEARAAELLKQAGGA